MRWTHCPLMFLIVPETVSSQVSSLNLFMHHVLLSEHLRHIFLQQSLPPSSTVNSNLINHLSSVSQSFRQIPVAVSNAHHSLKTPPSNSSVDPQRPNHTCHITFLQLPFEQSHQHLKLRYQLIEIHNFIILKIIDIMSYEYFYKLPTSSVSTHHMPKAPILG